MFGDTGIRASLMIRSGARAGLRLVECGPSLPELRFAWFSDESDHCNVSGPTAADAIAAAEKVWGPRGFRIEGAIG